MIPRRPLFKHTKTQHDKDMDKIYEIIEHLYNMGYTYCENEHDIIKIIETDNIDISQFNFPENNYEKFKQNVQKHKYEIQLNIMTKEDEQQLKSDLKNKKINIMY